MYGRRLLIIGGLAVAACAGDSAESTASKAALLSSGDTVAIYDAGVVAYRGQRFADAREFWHRAADLGDREAASNLGYLLYHGFGGPADSARARVLWRQAMVALDAEAHRHVAQAILDGDRASGTDDEGFSHAVAAFVLGTTSSQLAGHEVSRDAGPLVEALRPRLTPTEQVVAERRGREWALRYREP
jgi:TPR repeat protein